MDADTDAGTTPVGDASTDTQPGPNDAGADAVAPGAPDAPSGVTAAPVAVVTTVSTFAGSTSGFADGTGAAAQFSDPRGLAIDAAGNIYVADAGNHRIRKVTPAGVVTTLAGSGTATFADGTGAAASFAIPLGVAVDAAGNVYVADGGNHRIRKVTAAGVVTTLAGSGTAAFANGTGAAASFSGPTGVAVDFNNNVYVADSTNHRIRFVTPAGVVSTPAGSAQGFADGTGAAANFAFPSAIAVDGSNTWIADSNNHRIRRMSPAGAVTTLAGSSVFNPFADGIGAAATFFSPRGVALDRAGNAYVADQNHQRIRKITPAGEVTTLAGSGTSGFADGPAATAQFGNPFGITVDSAGDVYVGDGNNNRVRKITSAGVRQLAVSWTAPTNAGTSAIIGYTATASAAGQMPRECTTTGATSCTIGGLTSGVTYTVAVAARNAAGPSAPSTPATATPN